MRSATPVVVLAFVATLTLLAALACITATVTPIAILGTTSPSPQQQLSEVSSAMNLSTTVPTTLPHGRTSTSEYVLPSQLSSRVNLSSSAHSTRPTMKSSVELGPEWRRLIDEAVDSIWRQRQPAHPKTPEGEPTTNLNPQQQQQEQEQEQKQEQEQEPEVDNEVIRLNLNEKPKPGVDMQIQFVDGKVYYRYVNETPVPKWRVQRLHNLMTTILMAHKQGGNFPNFELLGAGNDCPCHREHCFSVVACSLHRHRAYINIPYAQWYDDRDGPLAGVDHQVKERVEVGRRLPWEHRASVAVFRGKINRMTTVEGLPNDAFFLRWEAANTSLWTQYGRGKLLTLRTQEKSPPRLNVSLTTGWLWSSPPHSEQWLRALANLTMDEPAFIAMEEQAARFKYAIYAEGNCGWSDRLKWQLSLGLVPLMQETRCKEWYTRMLKPWENYIPVDGLFNNLTAAIDWARANDERVHDMALANMEFATNIISRAAMVYYTQRLVHSYIEHLHADNRPATHDPRFSLWDPPT